MGSKSTAAFMGDITSDSKGTDNMPMAGKPPLDNPTRKAPTLASQKINGQDSRLCQPPSASNRSIGHVTGCSTGIRLSAHPRNCLAANAHTMREASGPWVSLNG